MNPNENSPRFDISTFVPLGVGAISLFGICLLLIAGRLATPRSTVEVPDTATPFHYLFLGTEPGISSAIPPLDEEGLDISPESTSTRQVGFSITAQSGFAGLYSKTPTSRATQATSSNLTPHVGSPTSTVRPSLTTHFPTVTRPGSTSTAVTLFTPVAPTSTSAVFRTQTPASAGPPPLNPGTYDDTDPRITYDGSWGNQTGVPGAENGTLHVSATIGNTITFRFIGSELRIFYQSGASLGYMAIVIDNEQFPLLNQAGLPSVKNEWTITGLTNGTHTVNITHSSGGSVNIDQIIVPDIILPTSTPTATATSTP